MQVLACQGRFYFSGRVCFFPWAFLSGRIIYASLYLLQVLKRRFLILQGIPVWCRLFLQGEGRNQAGLDWILLHTQLRLQVRRCLFSPEARLHRVCLLLQDGSNPLSCRPSVSSLPPSSRRGYRWRIQQRLSGFRRVWVRHGLLFCLFLWRGLLL